MSRWLLIVCAAISGFSGLLSTETQAQWYGAVDFMAPRRSVNTNAVFQRGTVIETERDVVSITTTTELSLPDDETITTVEETPLRIHDRTEMRVGDRLLSANDVDFGHTAAGRLTLGRRFGYFGIEGSFLWTESWDGSASVSGSSGDLVSPFIRPGSLLYEHDRIEHIPSETTTTEEMWLPGLSELNTFAEIDYQSKLMTGDINALGVLIEGDRGTVTGLAGFRFTELEEHFNYSSTSAALDGSIGFPSGTSPSQAVDVRNRLFGPQIGLMVVSPITQRAFLTLSAKTALAYNRMQRQTRWQPDTALDDAFTYHTRDSHASLLGDFSIGGNFFVTPHFAIKLGFDVLTIGDVALASDNFRTDIDRLGTSDTAIRHRSRANYYSPTIGALLTF